MSVPACRRIVPLELLAIVLLLGCSDSPVDTGDLWAYKVTDGACGTLQFAESLAADSASAIEELETRRLQGIFSGQDVRFEPYPLQVADREGDVPHERFYGVKVLDPGGGLVASVSDVITTSGDLFWLSWCPD